MKKKDLWRPTETILKLEYVQREEIQEIKNAFLESMQETQSELSENEEDFFEVLLKMLEDEEENKGTFAVNEIAGCRFREEMELGKCCRKRIGINR